MNKENSTRLSIKFSGFAAGLRHTVDKSLQNFWILQIAWWIGLWILTTLPNYRYYSQIPKWFWGGLATNSSGFIISSVLRYVYKKIQLQTKTIGNLIISVFTFSFIFTALWYALDLAFTTIVYSPAQVFSTLSVATFFRGIFSYLPLFLAWNGVYLGFKYWQEWKQQEVQVEKANALAQSAQLQMLRYQLNPHFLFNSLNSIRALIDEDKTNARNMVTELAEFLRYSLVSKNFSNVPLSNEIDAIQHYFAIEKKRFEENLDVHIDISHEAEDYPVLSFLIHPLIENAIKYGMKTSPMPLNIWITAKVNDQTLSIEICNSGKWIDRTLTKKEEYQAGTGTGLDNVRSRLENAFPGRYKMEIKEKNGRVCIRLEITSEIEGHNV